MSVARRVKPLDPAAFYGWIVASATAWGRDGTVRTAIKCRRRCAGHILATRDASTLSWACGRCDAHGVITGWAGSTSDLSATTPIERPAELFVDRPTFVRLAALSLPPRPAARSREARPTRPGSP
jgi:hypothetical protein